VWGNQYPKWILSLSQSDQLTAITQWIEAVGVRYANRTDFIDVVNEPIHTNCPFKDALGGDGTTGWDWIITAFELARKNFPNTKLLINEFSIVNDPKARKTYKEIATLLKGRGLIDGIGAQSHCFNIDHLKASDMQEALDDLATVGLPLFVSELDIQGQRSISEAGQLAQYQELFPTIYNHSSVQGITLWGYVVGTTWSAHSHPHPHFIRIHIHTLCSPLTHTLYSQEKRHRIDERRWDGAKRTHLAPRSWLPETKAAGTAHTFSSDPCAPLTVRAAKHDV
jgi:endo-1,4-beta-xylanase